MTNEEKYQWFVENLGMMFHPFRNNSYATFASFGDSIPTEIWDDAESWFKQSDLYKQNLIERRAQFVYDAARLAAAAAEAPIVPALWNEREEPFKEQFREVIERQCGDRRLRSQEELHGGWMQAYAEMGWTYGEEYDRENKVHPDLVPYAELEQREQDKDAVFIALCEIARQWMR